MPGLQRDPAEPGLCSAACFMGKEPRPDDERPEAEVSMDLTENQTNLLMYCEQTKKRQSEHGDLKDLIYVGMEHFLLEHARWYEPAPWDGDKYTQGARRACFSNAMVLAKARSHLRYVEGFACIVPTHPRKGGTISAPVHHAWNLDLNGRVVDTTWKNSGVLYFGVEFSAGRAEHVINGGTNVLCNWPYYPLFRERWDGEDYSIDWNQVPLKLE